MRRGIAIFFTVLCGISVLSVTPVFAQTSGKIRVKKIQANQIVLKGVHSVVKARGKASVVIDDKTKITGSMNVGGDITMESGKTIDGIDISDVASKILSAETALVALQLRAELPSGCTTGQVPKYTGTAWECADDEEGGEGVAYTAGEGIAIEGNTISSTIEDTDTTYDTNPDSGLELSGTSFSLKECDSGEFLQQYAGSWICQRYDTLDQYDNLLIVAKSGATFSTISAAMDSITDANNYNRYVILVQPGVYEEHIDMKDNVTIQGVDKESVFIADGATTSTSGTINAASNTVISDVTIYAAGADGGASPTIGVYASFTSIVRLDNVDIQLIDPLGDAYGVYSESTATIVDSIISVGDSPTLGVGVYSEGYLTINRSNISVSRAVTSIAVQQVDASESNILTKIFDSQLLIVGRNDNDTCTGYIQSGTAGMQTDIFSSRVSVTNCQTDTIAIENTDGTLNVDNSKIVSSNQAVVNNSGSVNMGGGMVSGTVTGTAKCALSYNETYDELGTDCAALP